MNFDDLKTAWNNEQDTAVKIPDSVGKLKSAYTPLGQLRHKMKVEFYAQIVAVLLIAFTPQLASFGSSLYLPFYALYAIFFSLSAYYLAKLFIFYKKIDLNNLNTRDSLYETYYELKLNIEVYKSFSYSLFPFAFIFGAMLILNMKNGKLIKAAIENGLNDQQILWFTISFIVMMAIVTLITEVYVARQYGRFAKKLKNIIDELKESN